jgi:NTE family protein
VLWWFEQHQIPIDYLSGNSMGAMVGGMYATGKSQDELEVLVKHINWPIVIGDETPYEGNRNDPGAADLSSAG